MYMVLSNAKEYLFFKKSSRLETAMSVFVLLFVY